MVWGKLVKTDRILKLCARMAKFAEFCTRGDCPPQNVLKTFLRFVLLLLYIKNVSLYIKILYFVTNQRWMLRGWVKLYSKHGVFYPLLNERASLPRQGNVVTAQGTAQQTEQEKTKVVSNRKCSMCLKRQTASALWYHPTAYFSAGTAAMKRRKEERWNTTCLELSHCNSDYY